MKHTPTIHHRRSIRLKGFDYSQNGAYFITICSHNRKCLFGEINNNKMFLNQFGTIVHEELIRTPHIRDEIKIDEFIVMPNHLHAIVFIYNYDQEIQRKLDRLAPLKGPKNKSISSLVAGFKSCVTKKINILCDKSHFKVWQRNYHEHIIRNEASLEILREYVVNNPRTWENDVLFSC